MKNSNDCKAILEVWSGAAILISQLPECEKQIIETAKKYIDNRLWDKTETEIEAILETYEENRID